MTKKDIINCLLMAPFLLGLLGLGTYALVLVAAQTPLVFVILVIIAVFLTGFFRFLEDCE
jgi:hypothetical protein